MRYGERLLLPEHTGAPADESAGARPMTPAPRPGQVPAPIHTAGRHRAPDRRSRLSRPPAARPTWRPRPHQAPGASRRPAVSQRAGLPAQVTAYPSAIARQSAQAATAAAHAPPRRPPVPDAKISAELGIPIGRIGPDRGRCLAMLRAHPAIAALINAGHANAEPAPPGHSSPAMTRHRQPLLPPA